MIAVNLFANASADAPEGVYYSVLDYLSQSILDNGIDDSVV
ncbi:MAG: hypothetical protein V7K88_31970 [Nostoc sp.]